MGRYHFRETLHREDGEAWWQTHMLVELTAKEQREIEKEHGPLTVRYVPCHASQAHEWVRRGGLHGTALYTDEGRIRYARDGF